MMMATATGEGVYTPLQLLPQLAIRSAAGFSIAARSCFVAAGAGTLPVWSNSGHKLSETSVIVTPGMMQWHTPKK